MKHLRCTKCDHLNPIKTEYLLFCKCCGHKMENTFQVLNGKNSNLSFADYLAQYGEDKLIEEKTKKTSAKRNLKIFFSFIIVFILIGGGWYVFSRLGDKVFEMSKEKDWVEQNCGAFGLKLDVPFALDRQYVELNQESMLKVVNIDYYWGSDQYGTEITAKSILYSPRVDVRLEDAAYQQSKELSSEPGVHDFSIREKRIKRKVKHPYILQEGSYVFMGKKIGFRSYIAIRGNTVYYVTILFSYDIYQGKSQAKKIIESIRINKKSG